MAQQAAIVTGLIASLALPSAAAESDLRPVLQARYAAMKTAMAAHDAAAISAVLARDFVSVDSSNQSEDAAKMIQEVMALRPDPNKESQTTLLTIARSGDIAVVNQGYDMTTKKVGRDGKMQDIKLTTLSTDTWVNARGTWQLRRTVTDQLDYAINGQPVVHKVRPN